MADHPCSHIAALWSLCLLLPLVIVILGTLCFKFLFVSEHLVVLVHDTDLLLSLGFLLFIFTLFAGFMVLLVYCPNLTLCLFFLNVDALFTLNLVLRHSNLVSYLLLLVFFQPVFRLFFYHFIVVFWFFGVMTFTFLGILVVLEFFEFCFLCYSSVLPHTGPFSCVCNVP